ncbi:MAG TPA: glycosyltransferase family 4 protein [Anaerolineaceae bacterium]|nr:glycosyltransferase family 4 protein [Anaerolineaceae bacterium]
MTSENVLLLHYSAPPVAGGVQAVLEAQARVLLEGGFRVGVAAGLGDPAALPTGAELILIPEMDSAHREIRAISNSLEEGDVPPAFEPMVARLYTQLEAALPGFKAIVIHNVLTRHLNLPLTAALARLAEKGLLPHSIAWCHDFSWSSPHSHSKVHPGYPWDLLRTPLPGTTYVTISAARQRELAGVLNVPEETIQVVYNGIDPQSVLGLSSAGLELADRLELWQADPFLLMPVCVAQAKNIELAIHTAVALRKTASDPRVVVTGSPDSHEAGDLAYYQELLDLRRALGLERQFRFVYECGPSPEEPLLLEPAQVGELLRLADLVYLPSRREGFGVPVLEAGLAGIPLVCSSRVPAANEIASGDVVILPEDVTAEQSARLILGLLEANPMSRLRRQVRRDLTWRAIFERQLRPLLAGSKAGLSGG